MTGEPYAGADPHSDVVYVMWGDRGPIWSIAPQGVVQVKFCTATDMIPLLADQGDHSEAVEEALRERSSSLLTALADVRLSNRKREELAELLDADPSDVGKAVR